MSRTSLYKKETCCNPRCINGGEIVADYNNRKCWLNPNSSKKVFCTPECRRYYLENNEDIEEENRFASMLKTRKSRYVDELAKAMYLSSGKKFDIETSKKVIRTLGLSSPWIVVGKREKG